VSRLEATFQRLRGAGERALVAYFTAGDPSLEVTARLVVEAERRGADVIELGVPFSDPLADGPVIQRAGQRALAAGTTLARVLDTVKTLRAEVRAPITLLTYYNPLLAFGLRPFAESAAKAGADGVIVADLPPEEAGPLSAEAEPVGLDLIHLVAPTSTPQRVRLIARRSRGFIYLVSLTGVTGERAELPPDLEEAIRAIRRVTTKPVCVGFGIGRPEQVAALGDLADGVIVGSAIVRMVEERATFPSLVPDVGQFIAMLKGPLRARGPGAGEGDSAAIRESLSPEPDPLARRLRQGSKPTDRGTAPRPSPHPRRAPGA
jgi:tryptophan synthase alpha chain